MKFRHISASTSKHGGVLGQRSEREATELHSQVRLTVQLPWEQRHPCHCCVLQESCCPRPSGERRQTYNLRASPRASSHRSPQRMALPAHQQPQRRRRSSSADGGGRLHTALHVWHLPQLPGQRGRDQAARQRAHRVRANATENAAAEVLLPDRLLGVAADALLQMPRQAGDSDPAGQSRVQVPLMEVDSGFVCSSKRDTNYGNSLI